MSQLTIAAQEYVQRKDRTAHPDGKFDNGRRWYPSEDEECACCRWIRQPSRAYPYSLMTHCRSIKHIANLYKVDEKELRKEARKISQ